MFASCPGSACFHINALASFMLGPQGSPHTVIRVLRSLASMKLLNCSTLKIEEFFGSSIPQSYVILSHRWEHDEAAYQDIGNQEMMEKKEGWNKIRQTCCLAKEKGFKYVWADTCCINKQDFTELTEAINSMFKWYASSALCFAYLSDIGPGQAMDESVWFTRGWTLQELIAPSQVLFFDKSWNPIGTRSELCQMINSRTGISEVILLRQPSSSPDRRSLNEELSDIPVAVRMSWASERTTTRDEDRTYSLLGLFDVYMPLQYGEGGSRAFARLQEEIIKETNDLSLFAWVSPSADESYRGILAISPDEFRASRNLVWTSNVKNHAEYTMTKRGLSIISDANLIGLETYFLSLECKRSSDTCASPLGIHLQSQGEGFFVRANSHELDYLNRGTPKKGKTFHVQKKGPAYLSNPRLGPKHEKFALFIGFPDGFWIGSGRPEAMWNLQKRVFEPKRQRGFECFVEFGTEGASCILACGFDVNGTRWFCLAAQNGKNAAVYDAAMEGDMEGMKERGKKAFANDQSWGRGKLILRKSNGTKSRLSVNMHSWVDYDLSNKSSPGFVPRRGLYITEESDYMSCVTI